MNCYPEMNGKIVHLLELREDAISLYAARRIQDLEREIAKGRAVLEDKLREAEEKVWASLGRYKFWMAGYWAAVWIHLANVDRAMDRKAARRRNPFRVLVQLARTQDRGSQLVDTEPGAGAGRTCSRSGRNVLKYADGASNERQSEEGRDRGGQ